MQCAAVRITLLLRIVPLQKPSPLFPKFEISQTTNEYCPCFAVSPPIILLLKSVSENEHFIYVKLMKLIYLNQFHVFIYFLIAC